MIDFFERHASGCAKGLAPTWLDWMYDAEEQRVVHRRMRASTGSSTRLPILTCPDDLDFYCSVVIADVHVHGDEVVWRRVGWDATRSPNPSDIGSEVNWWQDVPPLQFPRRDYDECVRAFEFENARSEQDAGTNRLPLGS